MTADILDVPPRPSRPQNSYWQPISTIGFVATLAGCGWLFFLLANDEDSFLMVLDSVNLVTHEFGHPLLGIFGEWPMWWGGTIMQLLVPAVVAFAFWFQRSALSLAIAGVWFFENFLNIARYIADARAQELPLAGGGEHDWTAILTKHDLLFKDTQIADTVNAIGWLGMFGCVGFAAIAWALQQRAKEPVVLTAPYDANLSELRRR